MSDGLVSNQERALELLGSGIGPEMVAAAIGVSVSYISQLLANVDFAAKVADKRYAHLSKYTELDNQYDSIEQKLVRKMESMVGMMFKPGEILNAIKVINAVKRRGVTSPENIHGTREVVSLTIPNVVLQSVTNNNLTTNIHNQVVKIGEQDLSTVQSVRMGDLLAAKKQEVVQERVNTMLNAQKLLEDMKNGKNAVPGIAETINLNRPEGAISSPAVN